MVPGGILVEVGVLGIVGFVEENLREFEHVVGVARLGAFKVVDVVLRVGRCQEVFAHAVASYAHGAVLCHVVPEVLCGHLIFQSAGVGHLIDALKSDVFGHLCVGMHAVEEAGVEGLHSVEHGLMTVLFGGIQIFAFPEQSVSIGQGLVHASMFPSKDFLHLSVCKVAHHQYAPVAHVLE